MDLEQQIKNTALTLKNTYEHIFNLAPDTEFKNFIEPDNLRLKWANDKGIALEKYKPRFALEEYTPRFVLKNYLESLDILLRAVTQKRVLGQNNFSRKTLKEISKERSEAIHNAATKSCYNQEGVWKIGNEHVEDILNKYSGNINYNIVDLKLFNDYFFKAYPHLDPNQTWALGDISRIKHLSSK